MPAGAIGIAACEGAFGSSDGLSETLGAGLLLQGVEALAQVLAGRILAQGLGQCGDLPGRTPFGACRLGRLQVRKNPLQALDLLAQVCEPRILRAVYLGRFEFHARSVGPVLIQGFLGCSDVLLEALPCFCQGLAGLVLGG